jgi:hypothetical protein
MDVESDLVLHQTNSKFILSENELKMHTCGRCLRIFRSTTINNGLGSEPANFNRPVQKDHQQPTEPCKS